MAKLTRADKERKRIEEGLDSLISFPIDHYDKVGDIIDNNEYQEIYFDRVYEDNPDSPRLSDIEEAKMKETPEYSAYVEDRYLREERESPLEEQQAEAKRDPADDELDTLMGMLGVYDEEDVVSEIMENPVYLMAYCKRMLSAGYEDRGSKERLSKESEVILRDTHIYRELVSKGDDSISTGTDDDEEGSTGNKGGSGFGTRDQVPNPVKKRLDAEKLKKISEELTHMSSLLVISDDGMNQYRDDNEKQITYGKFCVQNQITTTNLLEILDDMGLKDLAYEIRYDSFKNYLINGGVLDITSEIEKCTYEDSTECPKEVFQKTINDHSIDSKDLIDVLGRINTSESSYLYDLAKGSFENNKKSQFGNSRKANTNNAPLTRKKSPTRTM